MPLPYMQLKTFECVYFVKHDMNGYATSNMTIIYFYIVGYGDPRGRHVNVITILGT